MWQRQAFENLSKAIEPSVDRLAAQRQAAQEQKMASLEAKLAKKDNVIAEISTEHVALKNELGELQMVAGFPMMSETTSSTSSPCGPRSIPRHDHESSPTTARSSSPATSKSSSAWLA